MPLLHLLRALLLSLCLIPLAIAEESASASALNFQKMAEKLSRELQKCKELKQGAEVEVSLTNATEEYFDKAPIVEALGSRLKPAAEIPGKKYQIRATLRSTTTQRKNITQTTYTMAAQVIQAEETLCEKSTKLGNKVRKEKKPSP